MINRFYNSICLFGEMIDKNSEEIMYRIIESRNKINLDFLLDLIINLNIDELKEWNKAFSKM